jgi:hypothetical protein
VFYIVQDAGDIAIRQRSVYAHGNHREQRDYGTIRVGSSIGQDSFVELRNRICQCKIFLLE